MAPDRVMDTVRIKIQVNGPVFSEVSDTFSAESGAVERDSPWALSKSESAD